MNSDRSIKAEDILTPQQLAERLQVGVSWVYEKSRRRGEHTEKPLPVLRCGRYLRFCWPDICEWLRGGTNGRATTQRKTT
jgi:hypothetical protein